MGTSTKTVDLTPPFVIHLHWTEGNALARILCASIRVISGWTVAVLIQHRLNHVNIHVGVIGRVHKLGVEPKRNSGFK